jgi:hypothetical protein
MRRRARQLALGAVLAVAILQTGEVRRTALGLWEHARFVLANIGGVREALGTPDSGRAVLSEPVLRMIDLLREHGVERYRYSERIGADRFVSQRLIEGAWPIRFQPDAAFLVSYLSEASDCEAVDQRPRSSREGSEVALARCR